MYIGAMMGLGVWFATYTPESTAHPPSITILIIALNGFAIAYAIAEYLMRRSTKLGYIFYLVGPSIAVYATWQMLRAEGVHILDVDVYIYFMITMMIPPLVIRGVEIICRKQLSAIIAMLIAFLSYVNIIIFSEAGMTAYEYVYPPEVVPWHKQWHVSPRFELVCLTTVTVFMLSQRLLSGISNSINGNGQLRASAGAVESAPAER